MLTLTDNASTVVEAIVRRNDETERAGLRIEAENPDATDFGVTIVSLPKPRDARSATITISSIKLSVTPERKQG